jgi:peptidoglycan/LPS O-acetylase OafA/YrhL
VSHLPFSLKSPTLVATGATASSVFPHWLVTLTDYGQYGVHLFLVLSGFCIHLTFARSRDPDPQIDFIAFWKRRLRRLYPPYLIALLFTLAGLFVLFGVLNRGGDGGVAARFGYPSLGLFAVDLAVLLLLLQNLTGASHRVGNGPFWTLALEEQLYMLYFGLIGLRRRWDWRRVLIVVVAVTLGWRAIGLAMGPHVPRFWGLVGPARWIEWALGAFAVEAHFGRVRLPRFCRSLPVGLGLLAVAIVINHPAVRGGVLSLFNDAAFGLACFVFLNVLCERERRGDVERWLAALGSREVVRGLAFVGLWSYSLYLIHHPIVVAAKQIGTRLGLGVGGIVVLRLTLPLVAAYVFFRLVERHFLNVRPGAR